MIKIKRCYSGNYVAINVCRYKNANGDSLVAYLLPITMKQIISEGYTLPVAIGVSTKIRVLFTEGKLNRSSTIRELRSSSHAPESIIYS